MKSDLHGGVLDVPELIRLLDDERFDRVLVTVGVKDSHVHNANAGTWNNGSMAGMDKQQECQPWIVYKVKLRLVENKH